MHNNICVAHDDFCIATDQHIVCEHPAAPPTRFSHSDLSALLRVGYTLSIDFWVEQIDPKLIAQ
jgi:hypothetical protein